MSITTPIEADSPVSPEVKGPDFRSRGAQFLGDFLADSRPHIGRGIGAVIVASPEFESIALALGTGGVAVGDAADGKFSRYAAEREGRETTPEGARKDDMSDKEWARVLLEAYITRALRDKDWKRAGLLLACKTVIDTRDGIITQLRDEAQELGVDIKAGPWGKRKTGLQNATFTFRNSPAARTELGKKLSDAGQAGATALSLFSGFVTGRKLKKGIKAAKAQTNGHL